MIQSMTGYGKASCDQLDKTFTFEIKSLNSKQLDLYFRLPNGYREKEMGQYYAEQLHQFGLDVETFPSAARASP